MSCKRKSKKALASAIIFLLSIIFISTPVLADEEEPYSITGYASEVVLNPDGSVYFDETITYKLMQESVEIIKPIPLANSSKAENMEVFLQHPDADSEEPETDPKLEALQNYTFELAEEEEDIYHITIPYEAGKHEEVTFVYRYKMMDTVFLYKDMAVFFWRYMMPNEVKNVQNIDIQVSLPEAVSLDDWSGYVRGAVYAEKELLEDGKFKLTVEELLEDEFLESVLLLPTSLFPKGRKVIDNNAKEEILAEIAEWEEQASSVRKKDELRFYSGSAIGIIAMLLCLATGLLNKMQGKQGINRWIIGASIISLAAGITAWFILKNAWAGILAIVSALALTGYAGYDSNLLFRKNQHKA